MTMLRGLSWALRDEDPHLEWASFSGEEKHKICLDDTGSGRIDVTSPESVKEQFDLVLSRIEELACYQSHEKVPNPVPITHGWPSSYGSGDTLAQLATSLRSAYSDRVTQISLGSNPQEDLEKLVDQLMSHTAATWSELYSRISTNGRFFTMEQMAPITNCTSAKLVDGEPSAHEQSLGELFDLAESKVRDTAATAQTLLEVAVEAIANKYADQYLELFGKWLGTQFFYLGPNKKPFTESNILNAAGFHLYYRRKFAAVLIDRLGIDVNVIVKVPWDDPSPAFSDPGAANVANQLDLLHHEEIRPDGLILNLNNPDLV